MQQMTAPMPNMKNGPRTIKLTRNLSSGVFGVADETELAGNVDVAMVVTLIEICVSEDDMPKPQELALCVSRRLD
jgi:hypothetical protein